MSFVPTAHTTAPDGTLTTIQDLGTKAERLEDVEPILRQYAARARRIGGPEASVRLAVYDDLVGRTVWRGRVKA